MSAPSTSTADVVSGLAAFPAGLSVLVVDDDLLCLKVVEKMLKTCGYAGTWRAWMERDFAGDPSGEGRSSCDDRGRDDDDERARSDARA